MTKTMTKKTLWIALVIMSLFVCSMGVSAAEEESVTATVYVSAQGLESETVVLDPTNQVGEFFAVAPVAMTVDSLSAEDFGYVDTVDPTKNVSALDVLVAYHAWYYEDFAPEEVQTDESRLVVDASGMVSRAFSYSSYGWSFAVNGETPHSDVESEWGGYISFMINQSVVVTGDYVDFVMSQDPNWADSLIWYMQDGKKVNNIRAEVGEVIELTLKGYTFMWDGSKGYDALVNGIMIPAKGVSVYEWNGEEPLATADENGNVSITFDQAGTYTLYGYSENTYIFEPYLTVNVYESADYADFSDLTADAWYKDDVSKVLELGYMNGMGGDIFAPDSSLTREQFVTMLYRINGSPLPAWDYPILDVEDERWSADAINWALETGITNGVSADGLEFDPEGKITREQMATMIDRYAAIFGVAIPTTGAAIAFTDADDISVWAAASVDRLVKSGIIKGMDDGSFAPQANSTRAQAAAVMNRLLAYL